MTPSPPHWIWSIKILFQNLQIFIIFYSTLQFSGGGHFRKACRSPKKESKQSEITCKQSQPTGTISKIQKRREFVRALCYEQCPKNSFKRLYIVKGLLVLVEKTSFSKEFRWEFQCGGEGHSFGNKFDCVEGVITVWSDVILFACSIHVSHQSHV
jgi:hypothetical protein